MVAFFLSGINLSIFFLLTLQYIELATHQIFCLPNIRNKMSLTLHFILFIARFLKLLKINFKYIKLLSKPSPRSHDGIHSKIVPTLLEVFLRHLFHCRTKAFNETYDKNNEFSNFKCNLVSRFNKLQDTAGEIGWGDTIWGHGTPL